ncbi:MAG: GNAT family N-acetyltransferase [Armatimonadetes bacterium]|nr:GNAT family N-acetyltransferase [Armatimonadota bacterium]
MRVRSVLGRLRRWCSVVRERRYLWENDWALPALPVPDGVHFRWADARDEQAYLGLGEDTAEKLARRRERGDLLVLGEVDGTLCFFEWVRLRAAGERGAGCAHLYKGYTAPEFRGRGISPAGQQFALRCLAADGIQSVTTDVAEHNVASIRAIEKVGFRLLGRFWILRLAGRKLLLIAPSLSRYGDSP